MRPKLSHFLILILLLFQVPPGAGLLLDADRRRRAIERSLQG
jgi:hypothetical protein